FAATNASAEANPRTSYDIARSSSTSAARKESSSSMTAIKRSLATRHLFPEPVPARTAEQGICHVPARAGGLYFGVTQPSGLLGAEHVRHADQIGDCAGPHLPHRSTAVDLYGDLTDPQIARDLLVYLSGRHQPHHLALPSGQSIEALPEPGHVAVGDSPLPVPFDGRQDGVEHILIPERL